MIGKLLTQFLNEHDEAIRQPFASSPHTSIITEALPLELEKYVSNPKDYRIYGSCGTGRWAETAWVAILDKAVTNSTTNGYYIVILFDNNAKQVVVALGIGWTQFAERFTGKQAGIKAAQYSQYLVARLRNIPESFKTGKIDLHALGTLSKGYENAQILSKTYTMDELADESMLDSDLRALVRLYSELSGVVGDNLFNVEVSSYEDDDISPDVEKVIIAATLKQDVPIALKGLVDMAYAMPPERRELVLRKIIRKPKFAAFVKQRDKYICQLCGKEPFIQRNGKPYAEADHIVGLGDNGLDHPDNMRCLCAQCHAIITHGSAEEVAKLEAARV